MKTIGLIGGMSPESTAHYYAIINAAVRDRLGPPHSARQLLLSVDFGAVKKLQFAGDWDALGAQMADAARALEAGGGDCIILCTNTMHRLADHITGASDLPFLHIVDATGAAIAAAGHRRVGLLGTRFTMEGPDWRDRIASRFGVEVIVPDEADRARVDGIIFDELVNGIVRDESRNAYRAVMARLAERGAEAIVLGCTEIMMLVGADDSPVPVFDTTTLHAMAAVDFALR